MHCRASGDVDLFLSFAAIAGWLGNLSDPQLAITLLMPTNDAINAFVAQQVRHSAILVPVCAPAAGLHLSMQQ